MPHPGQRIVQTAKVNVLIADSSEAQLKKGLAFADKLLAKEVSKGKLSQDDADATRSRLKTVSGIDAFGEVDLAIEVSGYPTANYCLTELTLSSPQAVSENLALKEKIFGQLAANMPANAILASNTSSISLNVLFRNS